jgi:hypothetical protein
MATAAEYPYETTKHELAEAIRRVQPEGAPWELAREILAYDVPGHSHVVGLKRRGTVSFYHCEDRYAVAVRLAAEGLADGGPTVGRFDEGSITVQHWAWLRRNSWAWVHPRYRWE